MKFDVAKEQVRVELNHEVACTETCNVRMWCHRYALNSCGKYCSCEENLSPLVDRNIDTARWIIR